MIKWMLLPLLALLAAIGVLIVLPSPIDAAAYTPSRPPAMIGVIAPNQLLDNATLLVKGKVDGAEDIDVDAQGRVYGATADGHIVRVLADDSVETVASTGGRPLGLHWDSKGQLIICDAFKGLLSLNPDTGQLTTLLTEVDSIPLNFTDDLEIARDGTIYFTDASVRFDQRHYMLDLMEARPWGRLIRYNPATGHTETLLQDLYFANGVALSQNNDYVLVNETYRYRITRYWLSGPRAGQHDIFIDNLPGFPDGVSSSGRGTFWVALATTRNKQADSLHPYPFIKNLVAKLPRSIHPKPEPYGLVLELDETGKILRSLQDSDGNHYPFITSVQEHANMLYLGSLYGDSIGRYRLR